MLYLKSTFALLASVLLLSTPAYANTRMVCSSGQAAVSEGDIRWAVYNRRNELRLNTPGSVISQGQYGKFRGCKFDGKYQNAYSFCYNGVWPPDPTIGETGTHLSNGDVYCGEISHLGFSCGGFPC